MILQKKPQQHLQEFSQICETILGIDAKSIIDNAKQLKSNKDPQQLK